MTDNTTLPADWAIERALSESRYNHILAVVKDSPHFYRAHINFARYIEKHEQPPLDPWALQARELAAGVAAEVIGCTNAAERYRKGEYDNDTEVKAIAAALRAAYEKGKAE